MRSDVQAAGRPLGTAGFARYRALVEESLPGFLSPEVCPIPPPLRDAMEYALTSGGKRIRPAALLSASAAMGGILGGGTEKQVECLSRYGRARGKLTYPAARGMEAAVARAESLRREALFSLSPFGDAAEILRDIVLIVATRRS